MSRWKYETIYLGKSIDSRYSSIVIYIKIIPECVRVNKISEGKSTEKKQRPNHIACHADNTEGDKGANKSSRTITEVGGQLVGGSTEIL